MALKYLVDLDLGGNEIQNFALQTLATAPDTGVVGQVYYDSQARSVFVHTGIAWQRVGLSVDATTITQTAGVISVGTIAISNVSGLQTDLDTRLTSAALTGYATEAYVDTAEADANAYAAAAAGAVDLKITEEILPALELKASITYVDTAVAAIVDSAPAALDTLNELAAALGDDQNFATTVSTSIGTKLNSADYTAADVLTKLLTVDGAASGLDADKLDGENGSYYLDWGNVTNKPAIPIHSVVAITGEATPFSVNLGTLGISSAPVVTIFQSDTGEMVLTGVVYDSNTNTLSLDIPAGLQVKVSITGS
jgi:hypothetical protein